MKYIVGVLLAPLVVYALAWLAVIICYAIAYARHMLTR